ncbi:hypothetical protein ABFS82_13G141500 [Erythranthe guttata]|uniref:NAC domain-containing protein n=1 Tax=Erythranthe guttata TaxID=4155 RepID=A0A022QI40_ERYGU|nr:PREDICTED: NAC domain-containing protein 76-like [Erythranthe guttata]EYU27606.1 hypothetical protein MIMGU_mgv1a025388mg [Erythranthe guttata]|eukprot:XP_012848390.1 PREDICTED: NAC domain-containing protein 76-like [Erythranthe guttata]
MAAGNGGLTVPPGFRFHPTEEELLYYYLRKKVSYEPIDFDVIEEVDLNKLEPWDLKEKCRIGSGPQIDWYFFSHKDKKYPTGTRTNRATTAGFWKATGRDKAIHLSNNSERIGMRKTLVFYTGRAPHGHKTDWIMHEYRLDHDHYSTTTSPLDIHEDGWVICRVFKKKNQSRGFNSSNVDQEAEQDLLVPFPAVDGCTFGPNQAQPDNLYSSMHLPQLLSPESTVVAPPSFFSPFPLLTSDSAGPSTTAAGGYIQQEKFSGDWSFLDKLLATHQTMDHNTSRGHQFSPVADLIPPAQRFPFSCYGFEHDFSK